MFSSFLSKIAVLNPQGIIAYKERTLMIEVSVLMLIIVIPVFILTFYFAWKYRASNTKAKYTPEHDHNIFLELLWWVIPTLIILVLTIIIWHSSHDLDPYKPINSSVAPITIQVVALDWKWLFIYPDQHIATINYVEFPENTPVNFEITADAPMNSFWIPQLGSQIYAMPGMSTELHLEANSIGNFNGVSGNISGKGFSGMTFVAKSVSQDDFNAWTQSLQASSTLSELSSLEYDNVSQPSEYDPQASYASVEDGLYDKIVGKYMSPMQDMNMK